MAGFGIRHICWGMALLSSLLLTGHLVRHAPDLVLMITSVEFAVWFVGAAVLSELAKWRKL